MNKQKTFIMVKNSDIRVEYKYDTGHDPFKMGNWVTDELHNEYANWLERKLLEARNEIEELKNG